MHTSLCYSNRCLTYDRSTIGRKENEMEKSINWLYHVIGLFLVAFLLTHITTYKMHFYKDQDVSYDNPSVKVVEQRLNCLAMNIYREAGNEPFEGKVGVAQVTLNRVSDPRFPKDICSVVHQKDFIMDKIVCQFSWYCDGVTKFKPTNQKSYDESYAVAKKVYLEGFRLDGLNHALYYHADYINPNWKYPKATQIGRHIFYNDPKRGD